MSGSRDMAMIHDLVAEEFRQADSANPNTREQALWRLERMVGKALTAIDRPTLDENSSVIALSKESLIEEILLALDEVRR